jgi:serine/threonine-protein kinase RsbW
MSVEDTRSYTVSEAASAPGALPTAPRDVVVITLPAVGAYLSVLRTATAGLAARLDFTLDEIEDLRIAVDEACAMLLAQAIPGADIECQFLLDSDTMRVSVSVLTHDGAQPSRDTFAWTVLSALAGEVDSSSDDEGRVTIALNKRRSGPAR